MCLSLPPMGGWSRGKGLFFQDQAECTLGLLGCLCSNADVHLRVVFIPCYSSQRCQMERHGSERRWKQTLPRQESSGTCCLASSDLLPSSFSSLFRSLIHRYLSDRFCSCWYSGLVLTICLCFSCHVSGTKAQQVNRSLLPERVCVGINLLPNGLAAVSVVPPAAPLDCSLAGGRGEVNAQLLFSMPGSFLLCCKVSQGQHVFHVRVSLLSDQHFYRRVFDTGETSDIPTPLQLNLQKRSSQE